MQKREGRSFAPPPTIPARPDLGRTGRKSLPPPAPLSPLTLALSRRAALFGAVTVAGVSAAALPAKAGPSVLSANDARLVELADTMWAIHRVAETHIVEHHGRETEASEDEFADITTGYIPVEEELAATSAASMVGVSAKARELQVPILREDDSPGVSVSLADDLVRLFGTGALS